MFILLITYKESIELVNMHLAAHVAFLDNGYENNYFVASGRMIPRTGGVIISRLNDRDKLQRIIEQDPFYIHDIADYQIIEFEPTKYSKEFVVFL